jgi:catechol 2,3-dioxygenase-like lactoylglutathione lyase family enzyme
MSVRRIVPDIQTDDMAASRAFYHGVIGLEERMNQGWVVSLVSPSNPTAQITLLTKDAGAHVNPDLSIEVADVQAVHDAAETHGFEIVYPLTDEPWGVRRFFVRDPNGKVLNILSHP